MSTYILNGEFFLLFLLTHLEGNGLGKSNPREPRRVVPDSVALEDERLVDKDHRSATLPVVSGVVGGREGRGGVGRGQAKRGG